MHLTEANKQNILLVSLFIFALVFWDSVFVYPIKLFVVLLHEMSHAIVAVIFGGRVQEIEISSKIGGHVKYMMPKSRIGEIMVASAGYLGSMFWGGLILIIASKTKKDKYITLAIAFITLVLSYFVIKSWEIFGIIFTLGFAGFMIFAYRYLDEWFHDYMLKFIGITSCLYVLIDIKDDLISRSGVGSDADRIAELTFIPSVVVGIVWSVISLVLIYFIFKFSLSKTDEEKINA